MPRLDNNEAFWRELDRLNSYNLSMAEFKGTMIEGIKSINNRLTNIEKDKSTKGLINYGVTVFISSLTAVISTMFYPPSSR